MREAFLGDLFGCQAAMSEWVDHILRPLVDRDDDSEDEDVVAENMDCALRYLRRLRKTVKRQDTWPPDMDVSLDTEPSLRPCFKDGPAIGFPATMVAATLLLLCAYKGNERVAEDATCPCLTFHIRDPPFAGLVDLVNLNRARKDSG